MQKEIDIDPISIRSPCFDWNSRYNLRLIACFSTQLKASVFIDDACLHMAQLLSNLCLALERTFKKPLNPGAFCRCQISEVRFYHLSISVTSRFERTFRLSRVE